MKICYLGVLIIILVCVSSAAYAGFKPGDEAPDFNAQTLQGEMVSFSKASQGLRLVEMGTTWCPSCTALAHEIAKIRTFLARNKVATLSVYLTDSAESIRRHLKEEGLKAADQTLIDHGEARKSYAIFSIPRLLLIDGKGKILFDESGLTGDAIKKRIKNALDQQ